MARPATRTARLDEEELKLYRGSFGTAVNAMKNLRLEGLVSVDKFRRAWRGEGVAAPIVQAIRDGWTSWTTKMVMAIREKQKDTEYDLERSA